MPSQFSKAQRDIFKVLLFSKQMTKTKRLSIYCPKLRKETNSSK